MLTVLKNNSTFILTCTFCHRSYFCRYLTSMRSMYAKKIYEGMWRYLLEVFCLSKQRNNIKYPLYVLRKLSEATKHFSNTLISSTIEIHKPIENQLINRNHDSLFFYTYLIQMITDTFLVHLVTNKQREILPSCII